MPQRIDFSLSLKRVDLGDQVDPHTDGPDLEEDIIEWEVVDLE